MDSLPLPNKSKAIIMKAAHINLLKTITKGQKNLRLWKCTQDGY